MDQGVKFYSCEDCKNVVEVVEDAGVPVTCCGGKMKELKANTSEGASEKHIPVVEMKGNVATVTVGETLHPMGEEHYIGWVMLNTDRGSYRKRLHGKKNPEVRFILEDGEEIKEAYAYCNEHGLWKKEI